MNKQEAIDSLECFRRNTAHILGDNDEKVKTIETCIMLVREAEEAERWIPCSERLPEDSDYHDFWETPDGAVIWCKGTGEIGVGWYYESTKTWGDLWDNGVRDIIAWMPLPEPYKGGLKA